MQIGIADGRFWKLRVGFMIGECKSFDDVKSDKQLWMRPYGRTLRSSSLLELMTHEVSQFLQQSGVVRSFAFENVTIYNIYNLGVQETLQMSSWTNMLCVCTETPQRLLHSSLQTTSGGQVLVLNADHESAKFLSGLLIQPRDDVVFWILVENSLNSILRAKHIQEKMQAQPECWLRNFCTWHYCHTGHPNAPLKLDTTTKDAIEMIWMEGQHSCVKNNCIQCLMPAAVIKQQQ